MKIIDSLFLITFVIINFIYTNYTKYIGLFLAVFTMFFSNFLIYVNNYGSLFMIKALFITFTSLCVFTSIIYKCVEEPINKILTWLIRLNIFILIITVSNIFLQGLLVFTSLTVPYCIIKNGELKLSSTFIPVNLWIILITVTLYWYYNANLYFKNNNSFTITLFSLFIPFIIHFYNNMYIESRLLILCIELIFDVFNHNKSIFNITW